MFENKLIDCHIHYSNFIWKSWWFSELIHYLNKYSIKWAVVFWLPVIKKWSEQEKFAPEYYLDDDSECYYNNISDLKIVNDYRQLQKDEQDRIFPLLCWFNPTDINSIEYIEYMFKNYSDVFIWIWEVFYRHDDLTFQTVGEFPKMNNKLTYKILEFSSKYDLPFLFHSNITSAWQNTYPKYLKEVEDMIREYPNTKIIWAHCWISRNIKINWFINIIKRLLKEYKNLYLDLSWVVFDDVINKTKQDLLEWVELTEEFSDRIIIWSDVLWDQFYKIWIINQKYLDFFNLLSEETKENVLYKNVEHIYKKKKNSELKKIEFPKLF